MTVKTTLRLDDPARPFAMRAGGVHQLATRLEIAVPSDAFAAGVDDMAKAVDYDAAFAAVAAVAAEGPFETHEFIAAQIARRILALPIVLGVSVELRCVSWGDGRSVGVRLTVEPDVL
ncbi:MAG: hypothetical protein AAF684_07415 [Pseudomonadota bacterium]